MKTYSELLDMQTRGENISPNENNKVTGKRKYFRKWLHKQSEGKDDVAYKLSMETLGDNVNRLQEYVISKSEEPAPELQDLVSQVYELRMQDINEAREVLDFDNETALTHLEDQESSFEQENGYVRDEFLGHLFTPLEVAYSYQKNNPDGLDLGGILGGIGTALSGKLSKDALRRAAQDKPPGVAGTLSSGGQRHYSALRDYFRKNPEIAKRVVSGEITDEYALPGWAGNTTYYQNTPGILGDIAQPLINDQLKRALPYIIGFVLLIVVVVYFASRNKK